MKGNQPARRMPPLRYTKGIKDAVPGPLWPLYVTQANPETEGQSSRYGTTSSGDGFPQKLHLPQEISVSAHVYNLKNKKPPQTLESFGHSNICEVAGRKGGAGSKEVETEV